MKNLIAQNRWPWLLALGFGALATVQLAGCNTIEGAGEDVSAAGEGVSDVAEDTNFYDDDGDLD